METEERMKLENVRFCRFGEPPWACGMDVYKIFMDISHFPLAFSGGLRYYVLALER